MTDRLPDPTPEEATVTHLRGSLLRGLHKDVLRRGGEAGWTEFVSGLSPATQAVFREMPGAFAWLETPRVNEIVAAHGAWVGEAGSIQRIRASAEEQLTVAHAWLLKLLSPATLVHQGPTLFRFNYRGGVARLDDQQPGSAHLSVWALGLFPEWYTHSVTHWLERALELCGGGRCSVVHQPPAQGYRHRYELRWDA
ncbi:MAG TPA: hypothetical protein VJ600_07820 [Holophagaceae bacterium]|nr:hypothetical protein [Holophagaceae bacterium]